MTETGKPIQSAVPAMICPLRQDAECTKDCAWRIGGACAVTIIADQCVRMGNEQYAMAEMLGVLSDTDPNAAAAPKDAPPADGSE